MRFANLLTLFAVMLAFKAVAVDPSTVLELPEERFSKWLSHEDFKEFTKWLDKGGFYPIWLEGQLKDGAEEYRVAFERRPLKGTFYFYYWFDMDEEFYGARLKEMTEKDFEQVSLQTFTDEKGQTRYQSIWRKFSKP